MTSSDLFTILQELKALKGQIQRVEQSQKSQALLSIDVLRKEIRNVLQLEGQQRGDPSSGDNQEGYLHSPRVRGQFLERICAFFLCVCLGKNFFCPNFCPFIWANFWKIKVRMLNKNFTYLS